MIITTEGFFFEVAVAIARVGFEPMNTEFRSDAPTD